MNEKSGKLRVEEILTADEARKISSENRIGDQTICIMDLIQTVMPAIKTNANRGLNMVLLELPLSEGEMVRYQSLIVLLRNNEYRVNTEKIGDRIVVEIEW